MDRNLTKLSLAGVASVAVVIVALASIPSLAWAQGGPVVCAEGEVVTFVAGSDNFGCAEVVPPDKFVFLTETTTTGKFSGRVNGVDLTGIEWADAVCEDEATAAGLGGTWLAWLSTGEGQARIGPRDRFTQSLGPYVQAHTGSRKVIAYEFFDLVSRPPLNDFWIHADGRPPAGGHDFRVWTGVRSNGFPVAGPAQFCDDWTTEEFTNTTAGAARWGQSFGEAEDWSCCVLDITSCADELSFYCFEQ